MSDAGWEVRGRGGAHAFRVHVLGWLGHDLRTHEGGEEGSGCSRGREPFKCAAGRPCGGSQDTAVSAAVFLTSFLKGALHRLVINLGISKSSRRGEVQSTFLSIPL